MKKHTQVIVALFCTICMFILFHSTPYLALRTHLFYLGGPSIALAAKINSYTIADGDNRQNFNVNASGLYSTNPVVEKKHTFEINKIGFLYFAEYSGEA